MIPRKLDMFRTALLLGLLPLASCSSLKEGEHHYFHKTEQPHAAEWGYEGAIGPDHWAELSPDYVLASEGRHQSPIDISGASVEEMPEVEFHYHPAVIDLVYNGHTIEEKEDLQSCIEVEGTTYVLEQFHFHSPSEHTIDGKHSAMEMHLVHKSAEGEIAVVGVMIEEGAENEAFAPIWRMLPDMEHPTVKAERTVDAAALLPENQAYYRYDGSFTTPPCTENVLWMVMLEPVSLSSEQIGLFRGVIQGNNRPVQPLNERSITVSH